jgi:50S ribosomal protein L16 3-hydroxylase
LAFLERWLGPTTLAQFRAESLGRAPVAAAGSGLADVGLFAWDGLDRVLQATPAPDTIVVARGRHLPLPVPREVGEARAMMAMGLGFVLRRSQRSDAPIAALADDLARDVPGAVHVQLFVTPGRTHGFGWHYDDEDVFILQTVGVKDYYFRANTVCGDTSAHASVFGRFVEETSPIHTATLIPGDFLYIPARWWHMAKCREDALSISVGVFPRA